jgi:hypothetical protein
MLTHCDMRTTSLAFALLASACTASSGTTPGTDELAGETGDGEAAKADGIDTFGMYTVTKIGAFECNGAGSCTHLELARANRSTTTCADGTTDASCEARTFDLTSLTLSASKTDKVMAALQASADDGEPHLIVKGKFVHGTNPTAPGIDWITFAPTEIWISQIDGGNTDGTFVEMTDNGRRCIDAPCHSIRETRLNSVRELDMDGIDWGDNSDDTLQENAFSAIDNGGAIVVGTRTHGSLMHLPTTERTANQIYLRVN